jgi:urease accessory protein
VYKPRSELNRQARLRMLQITERATGFQTYTTTLTLSFERRQRTRQRLCLDDGREAALRLPRGTVLRGGDCLHAENGEVIGVKAATEEVSSAFCSDPLQLARAAYHLGNRHVPVQVGAGWLRYLRDHVLDHMLEEMGLQVRADRVAFEPESGAYHSHD